jgi:hypothetical protein
MNKDKENLSIKYNTSKDSKFSKRQNVLKTSEENPSSLDKTFIQNERKAAFNLRKTHNFPNAYGQKQSKQTQENQVKRKSVSPFANSKFKKVTNPTSKLGDEKKEVNNLILVQVQSGGGKKNI